MLPFRVTLSFEPNLMILFARDNDGALSYYMRKKIYCAEDLNVCVEFCMSLFSLAGVSI